MAEEDDGGINAANAAKSMPVDPSVYEDIIAVGKQIKIAKQDGTSKEGFHRLGVAIAANYPTAWSMQWHNPSEEYCIPKASRQELKDNKHHCIPVRFRPDNHQQLYDELKRFRKKGAAGSKAYTYEEGFLWPPMEDFQLTVDKLRREVYKEATDDEDAFDEVADPTDGVSVEEEEGEEIVVEEGVAAAEGQEVEGGHIDLCGCAAVS